MFTNPTIGTVTIFAGNTAPNGWLYCQGQLLDISQYIETYLVIGTTYGGDGQNTFALPDLRGRVAVSAGQAPGMQPYNLGQEGGNEQVVVTAGQLPHSHDVSNVNIPAPPASSLPGTTDIPTGNVPAVIAGAPAAYSTAPSGISMGTMSSYTTSGATGETQPRPISFISPFLAMNYIICVTGTNS
jgi:microcystin-dependent protein